MNDSAARQIDIDSYLEQAYSASVGLSRSAIAQLDDMKGTCLFYEAYKITDALGLAPIALCRSAGDVSRVFICLCVLLIRNKGRRDLSCSVPGTSCDSKSGGTTATRAAESSVSLLHGWTAVREDRNGKLSFVRR